ncbi:MAG: hypothetical protein HFG22_14940 [Lachnospiraceae bacterium]|nr:hypothetical protein [Lachnospiraceae bacterium]
MGSMDGSEGPGSQGKLGFEHPAAAGPDGRWGCMPGSGGRWAWRAVVPETGRRTEGGSV